MLRVDLPNLIDHQEGIVIAAARANGVVTGTAVDRREYRGRGILLIKSGAGTGTSPSLTVSVEDSTDNSTFAAATAASVGTIAAITTAASVQVVALNLDEMDRYIRAKGTTTGAAGGGHVYTVSFLLPAGPDTPSPS